MMLRFQMGVLMVSAASFERISGPDLIWGKLRA